MRINEFQNRADERVTILDAIQTKEREWPPDKWTLAVLGELGELANLLKKVERHDLTMAEALPELRRECADIITYGFALMSSLKGDMESELISKFNIVSERWVQRAEVNGLPELAQMLRDGMINPDAPWASSKVRHEKLKLEGAIENLEPIARDYPRAGVVARLNTLKAELARLS